MTKKGFIYETLNRVNDLQIVESANPNEVRLSGVFGVCGIKNGNNRIYEKSNYGKMVQLLKEQITTKGVLGELEHPNTMNITLENVSHMIEDIVMNEDGTVTGTIKLLDTPKGRIARAIIEGGAPLYISSRGAGSIDNAGHVTLTTLATYDLVGTPGFSQARLNLKENQTVESLCESMDDNNMWMIVTEAVEDEKAEGATEGEKTEDGGDEATANKDDNKKDNNEKVTMEDLNKTIEGLKSEVEKLRAELHVAQENYQPINYDAIQQWITEEFAPDFTNSLNESFTEAVKEGVLEYVNESYSPLLQEWITEHFVPMIEDKIAENLGEELNSYVNEEYSASLQEWITEHFSPEVQNWVTEEFAPVLQGWVSEELAPVLQGWITEEFAKEHSESIEKKITESVSQFLESKQAEDKYAGIDKVLEQLANKVTDKNAAEEILKEQQSSKYKGVFVVENMPNNLRPLWEALSDDKKDEIIRQSRMYDFTKEGVLNRFWESQDMSATTIVESHQTVAPTISNNKYANVFKVAAALRG